MAVAHDPRVGGLGAAAQTTAHRVHRRHEPKVHPDTTYPGFVTRTLAFAIDAALIDAVGLAVGAVVTLVFSILPVGQEVRTVAIAVGGVAFVLWAIAYFTWFWTTTGQTAGNRVMRIRVVREAQPFRPRHALVRLVGMVVGLLFLVGYIPILITPRRRALHDVMARTVVIDSFERKLPARAPEDAEGFSH
jgi:uncharacterized RDD family membrane protein YckC